MSETVSPLRVETVAEVFAAAAALIEPDGCWTQKAFALDALGQPVRSRSENAVCWCAGGAIERVSADHSLIYQTWDALERVVGGPFTAWNDEPGRTQDDVVSALREAARRDAAPTPSV